MKIYKILNTTAEQYNQMYWETKLDWFHAYNQSNQDLQLALLNQRLHNFFDKKYKDLENHFMNQVLLFNQGKSADELIDLYVDITNDIYKAYPKALQIKIKKTQRINQTQFN